MVLGIVTALIVARPFVLGEDPGLLSRPQSNAASLVISLAWLIAGFGWALQRVWGANERPLLPVLEGGLAAVVGLTAMSSTGPDRYQHPGWLISWEWGIFLIALVVVRRLPRGDRDQQCLLAALVATAVSLSLYAIYQYLVEMPRLREVAADPARLRDMLLTVTGLPVAEDDGLLSLYAERMRELNVYSTFAHPNSFAGYLALIVPVVVGWAVVGWRGRPRAVSSVLLIVLAAVVLTALGLTRSRGAFLGVAVAGGLGLAVRGRAVWRRFPARAAVGVLVAVTLAAVALQTGSGEKKLDAAAGTVRLRLDYWRGTCAMLFDPAEPSRLWRGVGPGNFGRLYPRYMVETAAEKIKDPHCFPLEIWVTSGVLALAALSAVFAAFFWAGRGAWFAPDPVPEKNLPADPAATGPGATADPNTPDSPEVEWEYYLGALAGLLLAFVYRVAHVPVEELFKDGIVSVVLASCWFLSFAVLTGVRWEGPSRAVALAVGVAALLLNLCFSGGINFPSVAQPLWVAIALGTAGFPAVAGRSRPPDNRPPLRFLVAPAMGVLLIVYASSVFFPVADANQAYSVVVARGAEFETIRQQLARFPAEPAPDQRDAARGLAQRLAAAIDDLVKHLREAETTDPTDVLYHNQALIWWREYWDLRPDPRFETKIEQELARAVSLDPQGDEPHLFNLGYRLAAARRLHELYKTQADDAVKKRTGELRDRQIELAMTALAEALRRDPTREARLRFQLAEALFLLGMPEKARAEAETARRVDADARSSVRKLNQAHRDQLTKWLKSE